MPIDKIKKEDIIQKLNQFGSNSAEQKGIPTYSPFESICLTFFDIFII